MTTTTDLLRRAAGFLREWDEQTGGCDHGVGICNCDWRQTANDLLALADQMERAEPLAWCALNRGGRIGYFEGKPMVMPGPVGNEVHSVPLYIHPAPEVTRDAERYRKLRNGRHNWYIGPAYFTYNDEIVEGEYRNCDGKELDAAVDLMQEPKP